MNAIKNEPFFAFDCIYIEMLCVSLCIHIHSRRGGGVTWWYSHPRGSLIEERRETTGLLNIYSEIGTKKNRVVDERTSKEVTVGVGEG